MDGSGAQKYNNMHTIIQYDQYYLKIVHTGNQFPKNY